MNEMQTNTQTKYCSATVTSITCLARHVMLLHICIKMHSCSQATYSELHQRRVC